MCHAMIPLDKIPRERPDLDLIRKEVYNRNSPYYYPSLMAEFERNDTTMSLDKYRRLYLGYMFQEDYNPYRAPAYSGRMLTNYAKSDLTVQECDSVIKYSDLSLQDNPFDLNQMSALIAALRKKGQTNLADIWQYKFDHILMAIVSTGTGADEENAWYVIEPQHEYVLLNTIGYTVTNHLFYEPYYEYLTVTTLPRKTPAASTSISSESSRNTTASSPTKSNPTDSPEGYRKMSAVAMAAMPSLRPV